MSIKQLGEIQTGSLYGAAKYRFGIKKIRDFRRITPYISQTIKIVTVEGKSETAPKLWNGTSFYL